MSRKLLATAVCAALFVSYPAYNAYAQDSNSDSTDQSSDQQDSNDITLDKITVTGSLLPQTAIENANPVITISSEDISRQGFKNVYEVLRAQPLATGSVQDNQFSVGFTPSATTISLLGLSPGFTLILIDGRPLADYPLLYNGQSNFVDLSTIPTGMVDRIDILPGNQSSIYGSSAIAGVVNIILKKKMDGMQLNVRAGGYSEGGGQNQRVQFLGGWSTGDLDLVYGIQLNNQKPIFGYQRDGSDSTDDNPNPNARYGSRTFLRLGYFAGGYITPPAGACENLSDLYDGTTIRDTRPGAGEFCGSRHVVGYSTLMNKDKAATGYLNATYDLGGGSQLYGMFLYNYDHNVSNSGSNFWYSSLDSGGYIINADTGDFELFQHIFAPEETGPDANDSHTISHSYNLAFGARGTFGDSGWDYDTYYSRSEFRLKNRQLWALKDQVESFFQDQFLGAPLGDYYGYPIYSPDTDAFYTALTPEQYLSFQGLIQSQSKTWTQNFNATFTNDDLFELPGGPVGLAALVQFGDQSWSNPTDPRVINGEFWGLTGTSGYGKRSNQAVGVEMRLPVTDMFTISAAARYDHYNNKGAGSDSKFTKKIGLEFRPNDQWLFRGNWATAFRAPDMAYVFAGPSGFYTSVTDYYRCAVEEPDTPIDECSVASANIFGTRQGNPDLKSITATSWGYGVVWAPSHRMNVRADFYDVKIANEVSDLSLDQLLQDESACRLGQLDPNSATCVDALSRITRSSFTGGVTQVASNPINISNERVRGVTAGFDYMKEMNDWGQLTFGLNWNRTLAHTYQQYPTDPSIELLHSPYYSSEFQSIFSGTVNWAIGRWSSTLYGVRYGNTYTYNAQINPTDTDQSKISPYVIFNGSVKYDLTDDMSLALTVNNLANKGPAKDDTWRAWPYYNRFNFNNYGRSFWVEFNWDIGKKN